MSSSDNVKQLALKGLKSWYKTVGKAIMIQTGGVSPLTALVASWRKTQNQYRQQRAKKEHLPLTDFVLAKPFYKQEQPGLRFTGLPPFDICNRFWTRLCKVRHKRLNLFILSGSPLTSYTYCILPPFYRSGAIQLDGEFKGKANSYLQTEFSGIINM